MTAQRHEILIYQDLKTDMCTEPLADYLKAKKIKFSFTSTACWRGYVGKWLIENDSLYLVDIDCTNQGHVGVQFIFPNQTKVFADWFTGTLRIPQGKMIHYIHLGYASMYDADLFLDINKGKLISERIITNNSIEPPDQEELVRL